MKLEFSRQIFEKYSNIKSRQYPSNGSRVVPCGRTDVTRLRVAFRNFADAAKNQADFSVSTFAEVQAHAMPLPTLSL